jgi:tRNA-splicing ligase RtcB (3'-phosphate/5'-hydroxy nucleic acid ligase)
MSDNVFEVFQAPNGRHAKAWVRGVQWEEGARLQAERLLELPFVKELVVMPDTHFGFGGPVGIGVRFEGALIPSVIGVDIGCGMNVALTDLTVDDVPPEARAELRHAIETVVPHGLTRGVDRGSWCNVPEDVQAFWRSEHDGDSLASRYEELCGRVSADGAGVHYLDRLRPLRNGSGPEHRDPLSQLGTLGTGNHFFEVSADAGGRIWLVVHSGSRGAGARIGDYFTKVAQDLMAKWFTKLPGDDKNLSFFPEGTNEYAGYVAFMEWAQRYAAASRQLMMRRVLDIALPRVLKRYVYQHEGFDIHHNYLDTETMVARKGAVHLAPGGQAIIPGAMGARTYIVRGKEGLSKSLETCSHGAGRAMSRTAAERNVTLEQHQADLAGLECDRSEGTLDETTRAYKNIDAVILAQADLVEPEHVLTALVCVKGVGELGKKRK